MCDENRSKRVKSEKVDLPDRASLRERLTVLLQGGNLGEGPTRTESVNDQQQSSEGIDLTVRQQRVQYMVPESVKPAPKVRRSVHKYDEPKEMESALGTPSRSSGTGSYLEPETFLAHVSREAIQRILKQRDRQNNPGSALVTGNAVVTSDSVTTSV